jgi:hypothetical protein
VDDLLRSGRLLLSLGVAVATAATLVSGGTSGCGGRDVGLVGISPPRAAEQRPPQGLTDASSPVPADFRTRLARVSDRFLSEGHGEGFDAVVWSNEAARAGTDAGGTFADGAMLVEETLDRGAHDGGAAGLLVMEKRAETWRFVAVGADGEVVSGARVALCAECHRDAPGDYVFRTPRPAQAPQSTSAATSAAMTARAPTPVATAAATYDARSAGSAPAPSSR